MKNQWILCAALAAGLATSNMTPSQLSAQDDQVDLKATVLSLEAEVQELREVVENSERITRETIAYLQAVSKSSAALSKTLDSAEQKGFTAGINPSSREALLQGWRASLAKLQKNVPSFEKKKQADSGPGNSWR